MALGAGGFAQGLLSGFQTITEAGQRNRALNLQEQELEADEAARAQDFQIQLEQIRRETLQTAYEDAREKLAQANTSFLNTQQTSADNPAKIQTAADEAKELLGLVNVLEDKLRLSRTPAVSGLLAPAQAAAIEAGAEAEAREAAKPATTGEFLQGRAPNGDIVTFDVRRDRAGNILGMEKVTGGPQSSQATIQSVTANREQEIRVEEGSRQRVISAIDDMLELPDTEFGLVGSATRAAKGALEIAQDVTEAFGEQVGSSLLSAAEAIQPQARADGGIEDPEFAALVKAGDLAKVETIEALLAYQFARVLKPQDRLDKETIRVARDRTKLTGLTSAEAAKQRLRLLRDLFEGQQDVLRESRPNISRQESEGEVPVFRIEGGQVVPVQ